MPANGRWDLIRPLKVKTTQDAINLLGKLDALEARDDYRNHGQNSETHDAGRRPHYNSRGDRTETSEIVCKYNTHSTRVDLTMRGNGCMVHST